MYTDSRDTEEQEKFGTRVDKNYPVKGPVNPLATP